MTDQSLDSACVCSTTAHTYVHNIQTHTARTVSTDTDDLGVLRVLRLLRVIRVFKLGRYR